MKVLARKFKTASQFSFVQWKIIVRAYFFLLKARRLVLFSPDQIPRRISLPDAEKHSDQAPVPSQEFLDLFRLAWRYQPGRPNCLPTSLAKQAFLASYGYPCRIRIGVRKEKGELAAHAWCETSDQMSQPSPMQVLNP